MIDGAERAAGCAIGVDLGGTKIAAAVFDAAGRRRAERRVATPAGHAVEPVLRATADLVLELSAQHGPARALGVGIAGLVDHERGTVESSVILPPWRGVHAAAELERRTGLATFVDNDATAAGWGEYLALGSPDDLDLALVTVGTGIGAALVLGGRIHRGATNTSAELGNTTIDYAQGREHPSGNRGALNTLASGTAIAAAAREAWDRHGWPGTVRAASASTEARAVDLHQVAAAARAGDPHALAAIERGAVALGAGIANLLLLINPGRVSLMGGVLALGEGWLERVRAEARARSFGPNARAVIEPAAAGDWAGARGAAALALERLGAPSEVPS
ncbi:ROK family protein [Engelhardtia mirabilis]|uniref:Glucokinase n=1 Tax=Engelhardtia mirabilis TaxID=2528011 RepID=A0A518BF90_9BACT|nr:Glucokinase [Planctomycetes bacterium Pla133]QDU99972.1 Glucokinase [Planctomycetes bacterium Pla86]